MERKESIRCAQSNARSILNGSSPPECSLLRRLGRVLFFGPGGSKEQDPPYVTTQRTRRIPYASARDPPSTTPRTASACSEARRRRPSRPCSDRQTRQRSLTRHS